STNYSFQAEQDLSDFQDGLIAWQSKPARAKKLFAQDLAAWKYETAAIPSEEEQLASKQREWSASQPGSTNSATAVIPEPANK
ncbi:MAG: hypothetical protein ACOH10_11880, partial [Rhodoglobus sp.]